MLSGPVHSPMVNPAKCVDQSQPAGCLYTGPVLDQQDGFILDHGYMAIKFSI